MSLSGNKKKIFNDPIYGFITLPHDLILDVIDHRYFQRLRRIKQLGLTHFVYPGALHNRFHHAVGCIHLMQQAIDIIRSKGHELTEDEELGALLAILMHDIGHGPFSHALEFSLVEGVDHEDISTLLMNKLNKEFNGDFDTAIEIFNNTYKKKFLHQLVSSQLDMDRLDYLKRDSFYTGVSEGVISSDRLIKMIDVVDDGLVVQEKGIYSVEKFIIARRLMYWQVYLHKTVISAEFMVVKVIERAKELAAEGADLWGSPALKTFLYNSFTKADFDRDDVMNAFAELDDYDVLAAIKVWANHEDKVLSRLCQMLINRKLLKIALQKEPIDSATVADKLKDTCEKLGWTEKEAKYLVFTDSISNNAYTPDNDKINILFKDGRIADISEASDNLNIKALASPVEKYFLCYPQL